MAQQVGVLEIMLMANMAKLSQDMNAATKVVGDATGQMERHIASAKNAMSGLGMGVGLAAMTDQLRRATDAYVKLDAQVRINTKSQEQYNQALGDIRRIATTAQADIGATSMLYTRLKSTMDGTGVSMKQIATVTETVTYGLKAYGATSAEAASAALQLSQAMGSGRLGGEEFRAVMEAMPNVMKVLADSMGVPLGQLRELSIAGKITAEEMVKAFGSEATAEAFRKLAMESMTITGALQVLRNEFTLYIGEAGKTSGVTKAITDSVMFLAENLKLVGQALLLTAAIAAGKFMASIIESTTMLVAHTAALKMDADFNLKRAEAKMADVAATQAAIIADRELTVSVLSATVATKAAAVAANELTLAQLNNARSVAQLSGHYAIIRQIEAELVVTQSALTSATLAHNAAVKDLAALGVAQAANTKAATVATAELAAAQTAAGASAITWGTSVSAAVRAVGVAISTFIVAHPLIALATAIAAVATAIANWETVVKGAKGTFEWLKEAFNAIHWAAGAFGITVAATTQKLAFIAENWRALISRDSADRGAFDAKIKALDDLATAQKQALANEISVKAAEEAATAQKQANQKAIKEFMEMNMTKAQLREKDIADATEKFQAAVTQEMIGTDLHMKLVKQFQSGLAVIEEKYGKDRVKAAAKTAAALRKAEQDHMDDILEDEMKFIRERIKAEDARVKLANANIEARAGEEVAIQKKIEAAEWELSIIGKTKDAVEELKAARAGESIAHLEKLKESGILDADELAHIQKKIDLLNELKGVREKAATAQAELAAQKEIERAEKDRWKMVDSLAHDTFMNIANKGKNAFKEIGASIKTYLLEMLYKMTVQKFLINVGISGAGSMAAGAAQAAGSVTGGGAGDLFSIGSSLASLPSIGTAVSNLGTVIPTFTTMLETGATVMESASAALAGTAASFAAVVPYVAAAVVIANAIGLFGKKGGPQQGEYGQIGSNGYSAGFTMSGGDSLGNKALTESAYAQVNALASSFGKTLTDVMVDQGYKLDPNGTSQGLAYRKIIVGGKELTSGSTTFGKDDAAAAAGYLGKLHTDELMVLIKEISDPKLSAAADALMKNFGELENSLPAYLTAQAMQKAAAYSLMDEAEKTAEKTKLLEKAFAELGVAVPASTADFKMLMDGIDATTAEGQKQIAGLNGLIGAYLELHPAAKEAAENAKALAEQMRDVDTALAELAMSPLEKSLHDITSAMQASIDKARALAATESDLAKIRELGAKQAAALLGSEASKAYTGLLTASGKQIEAMQFQLAEAQAAYSTAVSALADDNKISIDQVNEYIQKAGSLDAAAKQYWGELGDAQDAQTQRKKQLLIEMVNAATAVDTLDKQLADARVAEMTKTQAAANEAAAKSTETIARQTETTVDNSAALQLAAQRRQLEIALMEAQGNRAGALAERRKDELAAMDESLRGMQSAIWAAQDAAEAAQAAREAAERNLAAARSATDSAMDAVRRAIDAQRKIAQSAVDTAREHVSAIKSVMDAISEGVKSLRGSVTSSVVQSGVAGMQFISNALENAKSSGYLPDANDLKTAISASTAGLDAKLYTSRVAEDRDRLRLAAQLEALGVISGDQLTAADKALALAERQLADLDAQLAMAQAQLDALRGIDTRILSVSAAIAALGVAIAAERAMTSPATVQPLGGAAVSTVGGGGDVPTVNAELEANKLIVAGMSATQYANAAAALKETAFAKPGDPSYEAITSDPRFPGFAIGTSYVPYDMVAPIHEGEEITPRPFVDMQREARDETNALLARLVQCTDAQAIDIAQIKETNKRMFQIEDQWNIDGLPATRV